MNTYRIYTHKPTLTELKSCSPCAPGSICASLHISTWHLICASPLFCLHLNKLGVCVRRFLPPLGIINYYFASSYGSWFSPVSLLDNSCLGPPVLLPDLFLCCQVRCLGNSRVWCM